MAQATLYDIVAVLSGSNGFGAGTYNSVTGSFSATLGITNAGPNVSLSGNLMFTGSGLLASNGTLAVNFDGASGFLADTSLGFKPLQTLSHNY